MESSLKDRKSELVRQVVYDAAIPLFVAKGFDETTVNEIAKAAGISRRTYFRYFASKDDLLAQSVVTYGSVLARAIEACPAEWKPAQIIRATIGAGVRHTRGNEARALEVIQIAARSEAARKAHESRMTDIERELERAFAGRKGVRGGRIHPRLFAGVVLAVMRSIMICWSQGEYGDLGTAERSVLKGLGMIVEE